MMALLQHVYNTPLRAFMHRFDALYPRLNLSLQRVCLSAGIMLLLVASSINGAWGASEQPLLFTPLWQDWMLRGGLVIVCLLGITGWLWTTHEQRHAKRSGFNMLSPWPRHVFIACPQSTTTLLQLLGRVPKELGAVGALNQIRLIPRQDTWMLEDKNYRSPLTINQRKTRRYTLWGNEILYWHGQPIAQFQAAPTLAILHRQMLSEQYSAPLVKFPRQAPGKNMHAAVLVWQNGEESNPQVGYLTRNLWFIGRSDSNDLVIKAENVEYRHARLEKIASKWQLVNLSQHGNLLVNNRRIARRTLQDKDHISIENHQFILYLNGLPQSFRKAANKPLPRREHTARSAAARSFQLTEHAANPLHRRRTQPDNLNNLNNLSVDTAVLPASMPALVDAPVVAAPLKQPSDAHFGLKNTEAKTQPRPHRRSTKPRKGLDKNFVTPASMSSLSSSDIESTNDTNSET